MDSFTDGTASLWQYDDRKSQLDLFCVTGVHTTQFVEVRWCQTIQTSMNRDRNTELNAFRDV